MQNTQPQHREEKDKGDGQNGREEGSRAGVGGRRRSEVGPEGLAGTGSSFTRFPRLPSGAVTELSGRTDNNCYIVLVTERKYGALSAFERGDNDEINNTR